MEFLKTFGIEDKDEHFKKIVYGLVLTYKIIYDEISAFLQGYNLSPGKFNILMVIKHQGKDSGIPQVDIGNHLILTASNMTKLIDKLEKERLVTRSSLSGDRRVNIVRITKKGSDLLDRVWDGYNHRLLKLTAHVNKRDQKFLSKILISWLQAMKDQVRR